MSPAADPKMAAKTKRDILITGVLLAVFAFTFTTNVLMRKKPVAVGAADGAAPATEQQSMADQLVIVTNMRLYDGLRKERVKLWDRDWARDPFVPQSTMGIVKAVNLTLKGILWDAKNPKAIVNEKTLTVGDTIYGYTVVSIQPKSVTLKTGEKNIELQVFRPVFDLPSSS